MGHLFNQGFFVRQPAWHGLGKVVDDYPGIDAGMELAGHNHQIETVPLYIPAVVTGENQPDFAQLSGYKALRRSDTGAIVACMNATYEVIQNRVPWELLDALFQSGAKWDTAGILKGRYDESNKEVKGQVYWCLALLDEPAQVKGDDSPTYPYVAGTWSHDGSQALRFRAIHTRIVCANTHHAAMYGQDGADLDVSIRHTGDIRERIEKAKQALTMARSAHKAYLEAANDLASIPVTDKQIDLFVETVIPLRVDATVTDRVRHNVEEARKSLRAIFDGRTMTTAMRNTAYGCVEAGVEYFDHVRRAQNTDTYFTRNVIKTDVQKLNLVATAREIALAV